MTYFVTGATGFIGRYLMANLMRRKGLVHVLVRKESQRKFDALVREQGWDAKRLVVLHGDVGADCCGLDAAQRKALHGKVKHVFHLAALYDLTAKAEAQRVANLDGTRNALELAAQIGAGIFHHTSSIAVAGMYPGIFREDMFEEAEGLDDPYLRTKHDAEALVRAETRIKWRIYRPGMVVGNSRTGAIDKIDGPYYFFPLIKKLRQLLPPWAPVLGIEGGRINLVPVDFVADAMDHIAHKPKLDGHTFHLTDPEPLRVGEVLNVFCRAGHAPEMTLRVDARMFAFVPAGIRAAVGGLPPIRRFIGMLLRDFRIPREVLKFINYPTRFDSRETERALKGSGIALPRLEDYAWRLWDHWERHLDPDLFVDRTLKGKVRGKVVLITGGSSGIGLATAQRVAEAGATTIIVARGEQELFAARDAMNARGGKVFAYTADLSDLAGCDALLKTVLEAHGHVDVLINNAGRSIRRSIELSYDRFHDFERTMQLNYFGSLRLIMGVLPGMTGRRKGHIINVSSIGVLANSPRFSAYVASKAALDAWSRCAQGELSGKGISFTTVNMPLVKTPMIAPTKMYDSVPTLSVEEAADLMVKAIIERPSRVATRLGIFAALVNAVAPKAYEVVMNTAFELFPDSAAAKGDRKALREAKPSQEQIAFAALMRGVHW
ncbi:SDR family oxidoreductase [Xanthomonas translucens]|uniref:SDR family oxidoreductase n=1 Tax=Xanthomonas campestris pv. translucens TaxID=343 RepID=UPI00071E84E0|nr:SDR family oxidoreductase [Xanthomonas translucens]KTF35508.1 short-chain dehydrogenase [Xanthomonas translucens pv. translucens]KWV12177.1 short-chain dehydrogenase [Xanthomonas translucens]MCT8274899.1 SDR family oxidoreductase [Xanthomonas translucens pv. translucens]MCT8278639.1 SDR family oxidoreductase [Xanthomonas translucens pv. translucens]MCT8307856.1 SDR family oxidoreductase [Xanthomonas translucens pv. translucens]